MSATIHKLFPQQHNAHPVEQPCPTTTPETPETPADELIISSLRSMDVKRIYGIFDYDAWCSTCRDCGLYRLPLRDTVACNTSKYAAIGEHAAINADDWYWALGKPTAHFYMKAMVDTPHEEFLATIFPEGEPSGEDSLQIDFPKPPKDMYQTLQRAGLAGMDVRVAVPSYAIKFPKIEAWRRAKAAEKFDPIVFAIHRKTKRVVVLGYYSVSKHDSVAMRSLVEILESLAFDL